MRGNLVSRPWKPHGGGAGGGGLVWQYVPVCHTIPGKHTGRNRYLTFVIMHVLELPPSESFSRNVNLESPECFYKRAVLAKYTISLLLLNGMRFHRDWSHEQED